MYLPDRLDELSNPKWFSKCGDSSLRMRMEEAQWMMYSTKQLKLVVGSFSETDDCSVDEIAVVFE
jgi:hypothetical protein